MKWFFTPPAASQQSGGQDGRAPGHLALPAAVLERHGARVLDPGKAALLSGDQPPRPTIYRARTLLIPDDVLQNTDYLPVAEGILREIGLVLVAPQGRAPDPGPPLRNQEVTDILRQLPRPVALAPLPGRTAPVVVDAWVALQTLRAGAAEPNLPDGFSAAVGRITLEHLLVSSTIMGDPGGSWGGDVPGGPGSGNGGGTPGPNDSYVYNGGDTRTPIAVLGCPPARRPADACASEYGRRPVVAVLDTGIRAQPVLDVAPDGAGGYTTETTDGFVAIDPDIQAAIEANALASNTADPTRQVIRNAWDKPVTANQLIGEVSPALGHCTFIAGIVRQVTPDAQVLVIRVMHSDDVANEGDIICALGELAKRIALAEEGKMACMVDVVSMSFGYFDETPDDQTVTSGLWTAIQALLSLGVVVVASAGNSSSSRPSYPAAFAQRPVEPGQQPVISVGALNPNGTKAMFSNDGPWVTAWAQGGCVVSTYPVDVDGSLAPALRDPVDRKPPGDLPPGREGMDPDDYTDGWAVWSGTSFSAPYLAALITRALLKGAAPGDGGIRLDALGQPAAADRAAAALERLHEEEERLQQEETQRHAGPHE